MTGKKHDPRSEQLDPEANERFESLAKRLLSVPKKEIDREVKAHERKRRAKSA